MIKLSSLPVIARIGGRLLRRPPAFDAVEGLLPRGVLPSRVHIPPQPIGPPPKELTQEIKESLRRLGIYLRGDNELKVGVFKDNTGTGAHTTALNKALALVSGTPVNTINFDYLANPDLAGMMSSARFWKGIHQKHPNIKRVYGESQSTGVRRLLPGTQEHAQEIKRRHSVAPWDRLFTRTNPEKSLFVWDGNKGNNYDTSIEDLVKTPLFKSSRESEQKNERNSNYRTIQARRYVGLR